MAKPASVQAFRLHSSALNAPTFIMRARDDDLGMLGEMSPIPVQYNKFSADPTTNTVHHKQPERHSEQLDRHNEIKGSDKIWKTNWPEDLNSPQENSAYCDKLVNMLTQFNSLWDGHRGLIKAVQHQTKL